MAYVESRYAPLFERLFRALGLRGPIPSLVTWEAQTGITLLDLTAPEYSWLWREQRYMYGLVVAAVAAQNSVAIISNPSSSTALVVIERIRVHNSNGAVQTLGFITDTATAGVQSGRVQGQDTRADNGTTALPRPQSQAFTNNAALAYPASAASFQIGNGASQEIVTPQTPFVLRPGSALWVQDSSVNQSLQIQVWLRERIASDTELS